MKVLTSQQMREADRRTIEQGTPGDVLMERAGTKVVEFLESEFSPLSRQRVVIFCGSGNNGGDGLVVGRLLKTRVASLQVVRATEPPGPVDREATIVVDALLGTGFREPVEGRYAELIATINGQFPRAKVVAVDIPSAMQVRADFTVTFAAPKAEMVLDARAGNAGKLIVADIGTPAEFLPSDLELSEPRDFTPLFAPRKRDANKGDYGHVLVVGGAAGKTGSVAMSGLAALRIGAGLVTVACADSSRLAPELMTQSLDAVSLERMTVLAIGPGLGVNRELVSKLTGDPKIPAVIDADALNSIAGTDFRGRGVETVLTPHPGEMARLLGAKVGDRVTDARQFARERNVCLVLKGFRTLIAFPDGKAWINPTGSPALAKGGTGDVLTGLIAGLMAQTRDIGLAVRAAVWLHGRAGELAAEELTEYCVLATDLLIYLPRAIREVL
ncbi:MAG: NAD(P)H-hydrate dehydratase [Acidobacteriota bacterium]|nr:NAD(P)H-hydrate dehydratase [Acidobacteriota bacterium]